MWKYASFFPLLFVVETVFSCVRVVGWEYGPPAFFLNSVIRHFQDYFSSYETGLSVGGAKTGDPREKPHGTPASRTWLVSHVARAGLDPTPDTAVK